MQYTSGPRKNAALRGVDLKLTRLRVLIRLAHQRAYLSHGGYEHVSRSGKEKPGTVYLPHEMLAPN